MSITRSRRLIVILLVVLLAFAAVRAGRIVTHEDPIAHADAIYVLGGSWIQRWLESADLYKEGYAPHIVISGGGHDAGERLLSARGVRFLTPGELSRNVMVEQMQIPADAVEVLDGDPDNTAQEAEMIKTISAARHWKRLIVITDLASTRRAGFAMRRVLGPDIDVIMRAPRLDPFPPDRWWKRRGDFRTVFYEMPKLIAYWFGLKG